MVDRENQGIFPESPGAKAESEFYDALRKSQVAALVELLRGGAGLPSFEEAKAILQPSGETYKGIQTVPIAKIVGSEGRYADFDRRFRPRKRSAIRRWTRIFAAHERSVPLPAVKLYELGGLYFVRDGNHRVSVARHRKIAFIDAEVTSLSTAIVLEEGMGLTGMREAVIRWERARFAEALLGGEEMPGAELSFSEVGGFDEVLRHVAGHREGMRARGTRVSDPVLVARSWYKRVFLPIVMMSREAGIINGLAGRTAADLYLWVVRHWDELSKSADSPGSLREKFRRWLQRSLR